MDYALTLISLVSFFALVAAWIAGPHEASESTVELKGAAQSA
jgi:hypothetical protein